MKETDLLAVKAVARSFLYQRLLVNKDIPFLVSHPFFSTTIVANHEKDKTVMLDITKEDDLQQARMKVEKSIDRVDRYMNFLYMLCQPYLPAFFKHTNYYLSKADYSEFLGAMWTHVEFPNADPTVTLLEFVKYFRNAEKSKLMNEEEYQKYLDLPDKVTIYRGVKPKGKVKALSWTLSKDKARWFADRFEPDGTVYRAAIEKSNVLAYFGCRGEEEVVVDYRMLMNVTKDE